MAQHGLQLARGTTDERSYAGHDFFDLKRLHDVIVGAGVDGFDLLVP